MIAVLCISVGLRACSKGNDKEVSQTEEVTTEPETEIQAEITVNGVSVHGMTKSEAEKKVYVLRQAELMNLNAQNAFLKLLEEPPRSAAFILAAASPDSLLTTVRSRCALLRDPTEQPLESEEMRTLADDYLHAVASQDRMTLLRWCLAHEGMEAQTLAEFLPAVQHRLVELLAQPGQTLLPETLCAQQLRLIETCEQYRRANVSVKHIFGLLSVSGVQARVQK